jgi:uncharacterized protein YyaL (SSP411 family)
MSDNPTQSVYTNRLALESSPYLLQHAHNPVDWYPWGDKAFGKAREEDKLVIISIGYSSCHWCHVMERESFENEQVAKLMNENFICIKVDREERPDVDQLYMDAVQLMTQQGGWPLNAVSLPDGRPVYAGTYFPKERWTGLLRELSYGYKKQKDKYIEYAEKLTKGIQGLSLIEQPEEEFPFNEKALNGIYAGFAQQFDKKDGGMGRVPKFPMPGIYLFLLRYYQLSGQKEALTQVNLTLQKMAHGGIYDQIGGGFSRYSTDGIWKAPHFEKMLYDNAQLISLYSEAWQLSKSPLYKHVVYQTIAFAERELCSPETAFYCALDADSEGVEGKYYVWTAEEADQVLGEDAPLLKKHYGIGGAGRWEEDSNILLVSASVGELAAESGLDVDIVKGKIDKANALLFAEREKRIRPGLDDKILLSWNALMLKGLLDAYAAFGEPHFLELAEKNLRFLKATMVQGRQLFHSCKNGKAAIPGFLEDYAFYIQALIRYYELSLKEEHLLEAKDLCEEVLEKFSDPQGIMFYFTSEANNELVARKIDTMDNVIPTANSVMANNLFLLGLFFDEPAYKSRAEKMLSVVMPQLIEHGTFFYNWAILLSRLGGRFFEVAITGKEARHTALALEENYIPNKIVCGTEKDDSTLPLLRHKFSEGKTLVYVCENRLCHAPTGDISVAIKQMQEK